MRVAATRLLAAATCLIASACVGLVPPAGAAAREKGPIGHWDRDDGRGGVRISSCGAALCGHIVWLRDRGGPGRVGQRMP